MLVELQSSHLFSDASPVFSADATSSTCHITSSRPEEALRTLDVICTYFRSFKYTCSDGNAFTLKIPKLEMPRNAVYVRTCALLDNTLLYGGPVHSFVISMLYFQHSCSQQNLLHFSVTLRKRDLAVDTCIPANARRFQDLFVLRLLYPELESSLSSLNFGAFVPYRRFSQRANVLKFCARHFSEQVVWWSPSQTWVPEMYLWDYRYYLVRRTTLIRAMRNFVRKYANSIHNLLWTPPNGIMVQKGWKSCVAFNEIVN